MTGKPSSFSVVLLDLKWFLPVFALADAFLVYQYLTLGSDGTLANFTDLLWPVGRDLSAALLAFLACAGLHRLRRP
jgi:hypothetical protein